jgi:8-oxo-dGTP diphosphatase
VAGSDARRAEWRDIASLLDGSELLAFDHRIILADGVEKACAELEHTTVAAAFCDETFTITELRRIYESVWGYPLDPRNFHRKVLGTKGFLEPTGDHRSTEVGRPAMLYRRGDARILYPPMLRATTSAAVKRSSVSFPGR